MLIIDKTYMYFSGFKKIVLSKPFNAIFFTSVSRRSHETRDPAKL